MDTLMQFAYVVSAPLFIFGLKQLGSPATARRGNMISSIGMLIAVVVALCSVVLMAGWRFRRVPTMPIYLLVGMIAGIVLGATYIALVGVIFLLAGPWPATMSRATIVQWGFVMSVALIAAHVYAGSLHFGDVWRSLLVGLVYLGAGAAGERMFRRLPERSFRKAVLLLLIGLSVLGLLN